MFIDEAEILIKAGDGGNGCVSFRREAHVPCGGPDGGDGGRGGTVIMVADPSVNTLLDFKGRHHWYADNGRAGAGANRSGRSGQDLVIKVPPGTIIKDLDKDVVIKDLSRAGQKFIVARGGKGGWGNARFATPTRQTPDFATPGKPGQGRRVHLELKLIADVGLLGLPNAGKSTLISSVSAATPKIAAYPFTTTEPVLGIVRVGEGYRFVMADLPGLIEGAHRGVGLGDRFLRHVERTRVLLHLVEPFPLDGSDPLANYQVLRNELVQYSAGLAARPEIVAVTKMDLTDAEEIRQRLERELGRPVLGISGVAHRGLKELLRAIVDKLGPKDEEFPDSARDELELPTDETPEAVAAMESQDDAAEILRLSKMSAAQLSDHGANFELDPGAEIVADENADDEPDQGKTVEQHKKPRAKTPAKSGDQAKKRKAAPKVATKAMPKSATKAAPKGRTRK